MRIDSHHSVYGRQPLPVHSIDIIPRSIDCNAFTLVVFNAVTCWMLVNFLVIVSELLAELRHYVQSQVGDAERGRVVNAARHAWERAG